MEKIFLNIESNFVDLNRVNIDLFKKLSVDFSLKIIFFHKYDISRLGNLLIENNNFTFIRYRNNYDLFDKIKKYINIDNIIYVNTLNDLYLKDINDLKSELGIVGINNIYNIIDKSLQRNLLNSKSPDISVNYVTINNNKNFLLDVKNKLEFPCIIKPSISFDSIAVSLINSVSELSSYLKEFKKIMIRFQNKIGNTNITNNTSLILEEYISGEKYSVDYFVDKDGKIINIMPVVYGLSGKDIGFDDFFVFLGLISKEKNNFINKEDLYNFLEKTVSSYNIRNSFIHQEFKIDLRGNYKSIEVNGRIGFGRLEMYYQSSGNNLLSFIFDDLTLKDIENEFAIIKIYSLEEGILSSFNESTLSKIKKLESFYDLELFKNNIGKEVGLSNKGYQRLGSIKLKHESYKTITKDIDFVKSIYGKLCIINYV